MAKPRSYGYVHVKQIRRKRPGRHAKAYSKYKPKRKKTRGQG